MGEVRSMVNGIMTGAERDIGNVTLDNAWANIVHIFMERQVDVPGARIFNRRFLNDNGLDALATAIGFDVLELNPGEFDSSVGGAIKDVFYGRRKKQLEKRLGPKLRRMQKKRNRMMPITEKAMRGAADLYVVYRHLCGGRMEIYSRRMELAGESARVETMGDWFRKFDDALDFQRPKRGRPPNKFKG